MPKTGSWPLLARDLASPLLPPAIMILRLQGSRKALTRVGSIRALPGFRTSLYCIYFYEERCKELEEEIAELRAMEGDDENSKIAQFVKQLKEKDNLLAERDKKLNQLANDNGLVTEERDKLKKQLERRKTVHPAQLAAQLPSSTSVDRSALGSAGASSQDLANANNALSKVKAQNLNLKEQVETLNAVIEKLTEKNKKLVEERMQALEREKQGEQAEARPEKEIQEEIAALAAETEEITKAQKTSEGAQAALSKAQKDENEQLHQQIEQLQKELERAKTKKSTSAPVAVPSGGESNSAEIQEMIAKYQQLLEEKDDEVADLQDEKEKMQKNFEAQLLKVKDEFQILTKNASEETQALQSKIAELEEDLAQAQANQETNKAGAKLEQKQELERITAEFTNKLQKSEKQIEKLKSQLDDLQGKSGGQEEEINTLQKELTAVQKENVSLVKKLEKFSAEASEAVALKEKYTEIKKHLKEASAELEVVSEKYTAEQKIRKRLLNELEDMKGKIRVYARFRPMSKTELENEERKDMCIKIHDEFSLTVGLKGRPKDYNFDSVFGPESTQEQVFEDTERLIQSAVDGYNVCIFAYGQTGSGKTFTIQGSPDKPGLTPRAIVKLFDILAEMDNFKTKLSCYMVEIYLDHLRDLLLPAGQQPTKLDPKNINGQLHIPGVTEVDIDDVAQAEEIFEMGLSGRKVRKTAMNAESSRSHLIFAIKIEATNVNTGVLSRGKISFVDLAGSEKSSKTGTTKEGQEEANAINMSLSALGNVITQLSTGGTPSYRSNMLTKLMQDSLGGTAKTLMFVNCSPSIYNENETKNSLDYAQRVKKIKNNVNKNLENKETAKMRSAIELLSAQMDQMKELLEKSDMETEWKDLEAEFEKQMDEQKR